MTRRSLAFTLSYVADRKIKLEADDLYKICMIVSSNEDTLGLKNNVPFLQALWRTKNELPSGSLPPFQASMVDGALKDVPPPTDTNTPNPNLSTSQTAVVGFIPYGIQAADGEEHNAVTFSDPSVEERIRAIWDCVSLYQNQSYTTGDSKKVAEHCQALDPMMRKLNVGEVSSLVRALATLNFYDFNFSTLLSRRCCELASEMTARQLCQTYYNLMKLNVQDSLVAIVRRVDSKISELKWKDIFLFCQALEKQQNTTAAPTNLVPKLVTRALELTNEIPTPSFYRSLLVAMTRYNCSRHAGISQLVKAIARLSEKIGDRDLLPILQSLVTLKQTKTEGFSTIFKRAEIIVSTMDIYLIDQLTDTISLCPLDSTVFMNNLMNRLTNDAGRLSIPQLVFMIDLISTYSPVRGTPCAVSLAFTANVRKESLDSAGCESVLLSLARMGHYTDDFFAISDFLFAQRQGIRTFDSLNELLSGLNATIVQHPQMLELIAKAIERLAPVINEEEMLHLKKSLTQLGVTDRRIQQRIFGAARQRSAQQMNLRKKNRYDPADDLL